MVGPPPRLMPWVRMPIGKRGPHYTKVGVRVWLVLVRLAAAKAKQAKAEAERAEVGTHRTLHEQVGVVEGLAKATVLLGMSAVGRTERASTTVVVEVNRHTKV